eukprot:UN04241
MYLCVYISIFIWYYCNSSWCSFLSCFFFLFFFLHSSRQPSSTQIHPYVYTQILVNIYMLKQQQKKTQQQKQNKLVEKRLYKHNPCYVSLFFSLVFFFTSTYT